MLNCFAYLATSVTGMLSPHYEQRVSNWVFPVMFGELAIMLWLIFMGPRRSSPWQPLLDRSERTSGKTND
jgi:hypothetical protein